jgi:two-component system, sensor histidine kinase PdtaS
MDNVDLTSQLRRQLTAFAQFTSRSVAEMDLDALMLDACLKGRAGIGATHAKLLEYIPDRDRLLLRAGVGWKDGYVGQYAAPPTADTAIGRAFLFSESESVDDYSASDTFQFPHILKEHDCKSSLNVPVRTEHGVFGVLEVDDTSVRSFSSDDKYFLTGLGNTIARAIELKRALTALQRSLDEKLLLAREMNHRIKNNLSLIGAMLGLQSRRIGEQTVRDELNQAIQRINNLALVHDRLQLFTEPNAKIDAHLHFQALANMLQSLLPPGVSLITNCSGSLHGDCIESLSLITNELVTNAAKYAFLGRDHGEVVIGYREEGPGWRLWVKDDGPGIPGSDTEANTTFGHQLIDALVTRLNAQLHRSIDGGTRVEISRGVERSA